MSLPIWRGAPLGFWTLFTLVSGNVLKYHMDQMLKSLDEPLICTSCATAGIPADGDEEVNITEYEN